MADLSAGDAKLVQYLNEAYGTEMRLETALQAHIAIAVRPAYKKRLKEHLTETKRHAREVKKAVKRLGGELEPISTPGPQQISDVAQAVVGGAQKAVALAQGPLHALRGTGEDEKQLKNAKTEYASEAEEIATYTAITTLAEELGDRETQQLARAILREEERMLSFLQKEIPRLTKAVVKAEIPASQRASSRRSGGGAKRKSSARKSASASRAASASKSASKSAARKPAGVRKATGARSAASRKVAAKRPAARKAVASARGAARKTARQA